MLTGQRSIDKRRPNGEHNLVEWAKPLLRDRRLFYRLIDPRLEGHFSIKGAQRATQLAAQCLSRDPKSRPVMSEAVGALKLLPNLKDMAVSSLSFQKMPVDRAKSMLAAKSGMRTQVVYVTKKGQAVRNFSSANGPHPSPYHQSPNPNGKKQ